MIKGGGEGLDPKLKKETHYLPSLSVNSTHATKKIMCKFFMMGNCLKNDKCQYLHSEDQNFPGFRALAKPPLECPMYKLGFCKNGPMCKFKHEKKTKPEVEGISEEVSLEHLPELPIWYLEHYFDKPIHVIFEEFEKENTSEVDALKEKYNIPYNYTKRNQFQFPNYDMYAEKKDSILFQLSKKVRYFVIICKTKEEVKFSMDNNLLITTRSKGVKFKEAKKSSDNVVFIILDQETMDYSGFVNFRKELTDDEVNLVIKTLDENTFIPPLGFVYLKIDWLWRTKLHYTKLDMLHNPLGNNEFFVQSKDGQEVSVDLGNYVCRMMIKRLTKEEVREYMSNKRSSTEETDFDQDTRVEIKSFIDPMHNSKEDDMTGSHKVYVTNISNLQVNISHNTVHHALVDPVREYTKRRNTSKRRHRSRSRSRSRSRNRSRSRSRSKSSSRKRKRSLDDASSHSRKNSRSSSRSNSSSSSNYDSEATVKLEDQHQPTANRFLGKKKEEATLGTQVNLNEENMCNTTTTTTNQSNTGKGGVKSLLVKPNAVTKSSIMSHLMQDNNKVYKNKLFSNAMEKLAESYLKQDTGGKKM